MNCTVCELYLKKPVIKERKVAAELAMVTVIMMMKDDNSNKSNNYHLASTILGALHNLTSQYFLKLNTTVLSHFSMRCKELR